jgi:2-polyprenyl-3-methyl-5-hydroxy-6-metoxy-1,4-benzoquinol methylase
MLQPHVIRQMHCPACGGVTSHGHLYTKQGCDILRCQACGLGRADTAGFDPATYYNDGYFSGGRTDGYADYLSTEPVLRRKFARDVHLIRRLRPSGRLLEIGCAYGFFLQEAKRYFDVIGIELAEDAAAHCRSNGLNVASGAVCAALLDRIGPVDVVVMLDVIEHLPDPQEALSLCAQRLRPDGVIVLTTGDFGSPVARWAGARWRLMTPPQHLWFFTAESFRRWTPRLGMHLRVVDHPWKLVPLSLIVFQLARMTGRQWAVPVPSLVNRVGVPVNLFDAMRIVLQRAPAP